MSHTCSWTWESQAQGRAGELSTRMWERQAGEVPHSYQTNGPGVGGLQGGQTQGRAAGHREQGCLGHTEHKTVKEELQERTR